MTGDSAVYDVTPEQLGEAARGYVAAGARIVGGCCGSTPEHVRAITEAIRRS
jgi:5-methyltetrahydrofolate--homocysteine methyltransferase